MLSAGKKELPEIKGMGERFSVEKVKGHIEGNKTIVTNLAQIAGGMRRELNHLLKFLNKELAVKAVDEGNRVIFFSKVSSSRINDKINKYVEEYVMCNKCNRPDTKIEKIKGVEYIVCSACGSKHPAGKA